MIVLGIDPGTASTGFGVISFDGRDSLALAQGTVRTGPRLPPEQRLAAIEAAIEELIAAHAPVAVAFESLFIGLNPRTIMSVCQARGAALAVCGTHGITCTEYALRRSKRPSAGSAVPTRARSCAWSANCCAAGRARATTLPTRSRWLSATPGARGPASASHALGRHGDRSLDGRLAEVDTNGLIIEVGGVGCASTPPAAARAGAVSRAVS